MEKFGNRRFNRPFRPRSPPVHVGDIIKEKVLSVGAKGDGVVKYKGYVIFVPNVKKDDVIELKVTKTFRKVGFGELIKKLDSGEEVTNEAMQSQEQLQESRQDNIEETQQGYDSSQDSEDF